MVVRVHGHEQAHTLHITRCVGSSGAWSTSREGSVEPTFARGPSARCNHTQPMPQRHPARETTLASSHLPALSFWHRRGTVSLCRCQGVVRLTCLGRYDVVVSNTQEVLDLRMENQALKQVGNHRMLLGSSSSSPGEAMLC